MRRKKLAMRRFWDREGRIFGRIHPVDLGLLILLAILVVRIFQLYLPPVRKELKVNVTVGLVVTDLPPYIASSISVGQDLFQDGTGAYLGKISAKTIKPAELILREGGKLIIGRSPRNVDLRVSLHRSGKMVTIPARSGIYLGKLAVRIGDSIHAYTFYTSFSGKIEAIRIRK
jgi:hypothetical protein